MIWERFFLLTRISKENNKPQRANWLKIELKQVSSWRMKRSNKMRRWSSNSSKKILFPTIRLLGGRVSTMMKRKTILSWMMIMETMLVQEDHAQLARTSTLLARPTAKCVEVSYQTNLLRKTRSLNPLFGGRASTLIKTTLSLNPLLQSLLNHKWPTLKEN